MLLPRTDLEAELQALWRDEYGEKWGSTNTLPVLLAGDPPPYRDWVDAFFPEPDSVEAALRIEDGSDRWVLALTPRSACLVRLLEEGGLELRVLGPLAGGVYRERITNDYGEVEIWFSHSRLPGGKLTHTLRGRRLEPARRRLRAWAEMLAAE